MMRSIVCLAAFIVSLSAAQAEELLNHWVQMAPGGVAEARVIVQGTSCPKVSVDGQGVAMQTRASADEKFPVLLCTLTLPPGAAHASVLGQDFALPKASPERILVLGDTGCRIKGATVQACNDPAAWPFPQVAAQAAKLKPDLVIHVGDYLYRESACPKGDARCAGSPWGDNWTSWAADFFVPAKPLLEAAPWVVVRGNHEECVRSGAGFLRLLGPLPFVEGAACTEHVAPYAVTLGEVNLVVMDNASAVDRGASDDLIKTYQSDFAAVPKLTTGETWLAMHHPIWGVAGFPFGMVAGGNTTLIDAQDPAGMPQAVDLLLAGHIHTFEAIDYDHNIPPQLIVGEGGDILDDAPADLTGRSIGDVKITNGLSLPGWGFVLMTHAGDHWTIDVYDSAGAHERTCTFQARALSCAKS